MEQQYRGYFPVQQEDTQRLLQIIHLHEVFIQRQMDQHLLLLVIGHLLKEEVQQF
jgi:hypothetical protein